jgi:drug/metabolite transporter (DMT)-like permease
MDKRFWICGILVSIAAMLLDWLIHGVLLMGDYNALAPGIMRTLEDQAHYMPWMLAAHLLIGFGLTWLYRKGIDSGRPALGQGLRFGAAVAVMATIPGYLIYYAVQPLPAALVHKQMLYSTVAMLLLGLLLAWLNPGRKTL